MDPPADKLTMPRTCRGSIQGRVDGASPESICSPECDNAEIGSDLRRCDRAFCTVRDTGRKALDGRDAVSPQALQRNEFPSATSLVLNPSPPVIAPNANSRSASSIMRRSCTGLGRKQLQPAFSACLRISIVSWAVTAITGIFAVVLSLRSSSVASKPSITGMEISIRIKSGCWSRA